MIVQLCVYTESEIHTLTWFILQYMNYILIMLLKRTPQTIRNYNVKTQRNNF